VHLQLNRDIAAARDVESILALCRENSKQFDAVNVATALHRIARKSASGHVDATMQSDLLSLTQKLRFLLPEAGSQAIAASAWSVAILKL